MFGAFIYEKENIFSGTVNERANALMKFYKDDEIKGIFDISGGDVADGILPYLDYDITPAIKCSNFYLSICPSASLSSIAVALATAQSSTLQMSIYPAQNSYYI